MGRGNRNNDKVDTKGLKQILGRIFRHRHGNADEQPFLLIKERTVRVALDPLIKRITENPQLQDQDIVGLAQTPGLKPSDIEMTRAYIHRFGTDLAHPLPLSAHPQRQLLLDENTPQAAMLPLTHNFGWATHVSAEGLSGRDTPDQDIWHYAQDHNFSAIVTRDTDFFYIQRHLAANALAQGKNSVPLLIFVPETVSTESLTGLFKANARNIRHYIGALKDEGRATQLACSLNDKNGCQPLPL